MYVERQGSEALGGLGGQLLKQSAASPTPSSVFVDGHRELGERLSLLIDDERRLVEVPPSGAKPMLAIVTVPPRGGFIGFSTKQSCR